MRRRQLTLLVAVASFVVGCSGSAATPTNATAAPPVASSTSVAPSETPTPSLSAAPTLIATPSPTPIPGPFGPLKVSISDCNKIGPHIGMATITYTGQASPTNKVLIGTDPNGRGWDVKAFGQTALSKDPHTIITPFDFSLSYAPQGYWVRWYPLYPNDPTMVHVTAPPGC